MTVKELIAKLNEIADKEITVVVPSIDECGNSSYDKADEITLGRFHYVKDLFYADYMLIPGQPNEEDILQTFEKACFIS